MIHLPGVSYVMPVLNEASYLEEAVSSIFGQNYSGEKELVLALGPSTDLTNTIAQRLAHEDPRIILVYNPLGRTPIGLNLAIRASTLPIVIRVDAHSELPPHYTQRGIETLYRVNAHDVGGLMDAKGRTPVQRGIAAAYHSKFGFGGPAYHSGAPEGPSESAYLGIFRREVFEEIGYYNEELWRAQDWELCLRIRKAGHTVWFDPELKVGYYPRDSFKSLISQSMASGTWRAEIARRFPEGKSLRHDVPPAVLVGVTTGLVAAVVEPLTRESVPSRLRVGLSIAKTIPAIYASIALVAGLTSNAKGIRDKLLAACAFPAIHLPWAVGYIKGRFCGAAGTVDKGRVK